MSRQTTPAPQGPPNLLGLLKFGQPSASPQPVSGLAIFRFITPTTMTYLKCKIFKLSREIVTTC